VGAHHKNNVMSYQVLARKYRPQQFDDIIAQRHISKTLKSAIASGRVSSGYLFTGPRGTGKTTTARVLAKALNCAEGPTATPCDKCPSCLEIMSGTALDVLEIDAASNTGVDDIRALRENVRYLPTTGKKRIYIIDEVHRLSGSAFDALLKTLEEPPPHVVFIFATTEPHKVPETIRSRTQRYDFHRVSVAELARHIKKIAGDESLILDDAAAFIIARKADGSVRDSLSLLDQLSAFAGEEIDGAKVVEALGLIDTRFFAAYIETIAARDQSGALEKIVELMDSGAEVSEFCGGLAMYMRSLMIAKNSKNPEKILEVTASELEEIKKQAEYFTTGDLLRMIKAVTDMTLDLKSGLDPRLLLETMTLKLASMESTVRFEEILARLSAEDRGAPIAEAGADLFGKPTAAPTAKKEFLGDEAPLVTPAPRESTSPLTGAPVNLPMIQSKWADFTEQVKKQNRMLAALLSMAEIREVRENIITAVFYNAGGTSKQVLEKPDYITTIHNELRTFFKTPLKIKYEIDPTKKPETVEAKAPTVEKIDVEKILESDKKLKDIVERFNGEIVGKKKVDD